ncbi:MAG: hypothetical protein EZS28_020261 [Streblomastix strix]|uniref:Uncharacterized protein n=1 Tax=Streblomastix strix TaxID=222440 RepID=A0A5J4VPK8_9EUKA|nr:MAG: hypothetical protein EZS28_020261 [Streblomastix strix]
MKELRGAEQFASQLLVNLMELQIFINVLKVFRESPKAASMYDQMDNQVQQQKFAISNAAQQQMQIQLQQSQYTAATSQVTLNLSSAFNAKGINRKRCRSKRNFGGKECKHLHYTQSDDINDKYDDDEDDQEQEVDEQEQNKYDNKMNKKQDNEDSPFLDRNKKNIMVDQLDHAKEYVSSKGGFRVLCVDEGQNIGQLPSEQCSFEEYIHLQVVYLQRSGPVGQVGCLL